MARAAKHYGGAQAALGLQAQRPRYNHKPKEENHVFLWLSDINPAQSMPFPSAIVWRRICCKEMACGASSQNGGAQAEYTGAKALLYSSRLVPKPLL